MYDVWKNVLAEIEAELSPNSFSVWFQDTSLVSTKDNHVVIGVKNPFFEKHLRSHYYELIEKALINNNITPETIDFEIQKSEKPSPKKSAKKVSPKKLTSISQQKFSFDHLNSGLNEKYSLANFVIGSGNDLAASAAKSIIDAPGDRFNPFFLYGGPGLGKTHLVQAIGNELIRKNPDFRVLYLTTAEFYSDFIDSVGKGRGKEFNQKFQSLDCLIIDDFQFIVGKEKSQEEFFNIFNSLYQHGKQIIVTSDRLPSQIKTVDERLASRLTWAGAFDLQLPKFEDRCAILRAKAEFMGVDIEPEAIEFIAENVTTNIRDLEGEFSTVLLTSEVRGLTPLELIKNGAVNINHTSSPRLVNAKRVVEKVAKFYQLTPKELKSKTRVNNIKHARQVAMYILSEDLNLPFAKIAAEVGVKDHTTVMHGVKKIEQDLKLNFALRDQLAEIKEQIYG